jgi:cation transport ATPase
VLEAVKERNETKAPGTPAGTLSCECCAPAARPTGSSGHGRRAIRLIGIVGGAVLLAVVVGEWLGVFGMLSERVPLWAGALLVAAFGYPVFLKVGAALLRGRILSHTLMSTGALAALAVGEWTTAALVVFFMRVGDRAESFTTDRARRSLRDLTEMAPRTARIDRDCSEEEVPVDRLNPGDIVVARPGEVIPVDGEVISGMASVTQSALTGEALPIEAQAGSTVFAATVAQAGALAAARRHGVRRIELLTGDNAQSAARIAGELGIEYRAELLPSEKTAAVRRYQAAGALVVMIGDGVNDAPALAQADIGIAMGAAGTDIAIETAHVALMTDDWRRLPELFAIARRTMSVVKVNIGFTAAYNLVGISLAALGLLPPILAAALQSIPDLGIMGNSARLLRQRGHATANIGVLPIRRNPAVSS